MSKYNKNGFTLVELIAVIAILGVILILVVPDIIDTFSGGKKSAFARQVQSVWLEAEKEHAVDYAKNKQINNYCDKNSSMSDCSNLSLSKTDISYYLGFDNNGEISYVAVGNGDYCYINDNPDDIDVNVDSLSKGSLNCSGNSCSCSNSGGGTSQGSGTIVVGEGNQYFYWTDNNGYYDEKYGLQIPIRAVDSYLNIDRVNEGRPFIRSSVANGKVVKHESCIVYNQKLFCLEPNYWEGEGVIGDDTSAMNTMNKLKNDMSQTLGINASDLYCDYSFSGWNLYGYASCEYNDYRCVVEYNDFSSCGCNVYMDGTVSC